MAHKTRVNGWRALLFSVPAACAPLETQSHRKIARPPNARSRREKCATRVEIERTPFFTLQQACGLCKRLWVYMPKRRRHAVVSAEDHCLFAVAK